ncbi:hypothetical protein GCM10027296_07890 [Chitinimonas naiadis]
MHEISIPRSGEKSSWSVEIDELNRIIHWADINSLNIPDRIQERLDELNKGLATGLTNNLFWPSCNNEPLKIQPDFTLLDTKGGSRIPTQADIYVAFSSVLNHIRQGKQKHARLEFTPYYRSVLGSGNFTDRFTDPIVQAAILRASKDRELAFGLCDNSNESEMTRNYITQHVLNEALASRAEALAEFLIAILCRKLILSMDDERNILDRVASNQKLPDYITLMCKYLLNRLDLENPN